MFFPAISTKHIVFLERQGHPTGLAALATPLRKSELAAPGGAVSLAWQDQSIGTYGGYMVGIWWVSISKDQCEELGTAIRVPIAHLSANLWEIVFKPLAGLSRTYR